MSRIHEALKKAEQERAANEAGALDASRVGEMPPMEPPPAMSAGVGTAAAPSFSAQFNFDTLLARAAKLEWRPDPTMLFFGAQENVAGMEEFRTLRSRLYQMREKVPLKKLLVSSSLPREGKSFVAANLAQVLVKQHGRRVLLIDADLRGPKLHHVLGTNNTPGLSEYLMGSSDEISIMQRGAIENLFFIPAGRQVASPAELVANGRLKLLLNRVEGLFDWIVMDSPPAIAVSDAGLLANFCDGVLMVVRSNVTPADVAKKARMEFRDQQLIGVVLNGVDADSSAYSRYYYGYGEKAGANGHQ
ncbi:MAG TPA: CpsD/CapB family tyrosine-protein kinase [Terriglobales bacterium]|nr:CpsD/CapB family tyrosine-protein kinase [Terriglobales bacterium]